MNTSEFAKKIAVLISEDNKIWRDSRGITRSFAQKDICEKTIGAKYPTVQKWLTEQDNYPTTPSIDKICKGINTLKNELDKNQRFLITRELEALDFSNDRNLRSVFEFAKIFGIDRDLCCKILDERIYYWELPLLPCLYYYKISHDADTVFDKYKGFYDIYRRGTSARNERDIFIMKLQVRYVLTARNKTAIRCKLNLPDQRRPLLEYDGFVSEFDDYMYWLFEARDHPGLKQRDCIFMLTNSASKFDDDMKMDGIYMSVSQDVSPKPVSRNITLIRKHNELTDEGKSGFMKGNMGANIIKDGKGVDSKIIEKL